MSGRIRHCTEDQIYTLSAYARYVANLLHLPTRHAFLLKTGTGNTGGWQNMIEDIIVRYLDSFREKDLVESDL